ncbi:MAG TPA: hypothetical protein PLN33_12215, partial [Hyphomonadaceae bacterium]|nr:hypothetical protein [Hyphomonadaceae bacterium]
PAAAPACSAEFPPASHFQRPGLPGRFFAPARRGKTRDQTLRHSSLPHFSTGALRWEKLFRKPNDTSHCSTFSGNTN